MKNGVDHLAVEGSSDLPYDIPSVDLTAHHPTVNVPVLSQSTSRARNCYAHSLHNKYTESLTQSSIHFSGEVSEACHVAHCSRSKPLAHRVPGRLIERQSNQPHRCCHQRASGPISPIVLRVLLSHNRSPKPKPSSTIELCASYLAQRNINLPDSQQGLKEFGPLMFNSFMRATQSGKPTIVFAPGPFR